MFRRSKSEAANSRSIDGMKGSKGLDASAVVLDAGALPWKTDEAAKLTEENPDYQAKRRQDQIIAFFTAERRVIVTPEEIVALDSKSLRALKRERANLLRQQALKGDNLAFDAEDRNSFLQSMARGEITAEDEANFLLLIPSPLDDPTVGATKMFDQIAADPRATQILAVAAGYNVSNWQKVDLNSMVKMLKEVQPNGDDYRTPVGFADLKAHFLRGIRPKAKEQVYRHYERSMNELEKILYGERLDYYHEFETLRQSAKKLTADKGERRLLQQERYRQLTPEQSSEMLGRAMIDGDEWKAGGEERRLSTHNLAEAKLGPWYEVTLDGLRISLSKIFQLPNGVAVMGYVPVNQSIKVRTFYRLNGQSLWYYLPDYIRKNNGSVGQYLAGFGEVTVTLPAELQEALVQIEARDGVKLLSNDGIALNPEFFLAGTAHAYDTMQEYQATWNFGQVRGDYYKEISAEPINHDFEMTTANRKRAPYTLAIDHDRSPDFERQVVRFETTMPEVGAVEVRGYDSFDRQYRWLFGNDRHGRTWIVQVEAISPVTSTGLRRDWTAMGDLMTPLYEPTARAGIYGDLGDTKGAKQCMWKNYLCNISLIQEYTKYRKKH